MAILQFKCRNSKVLHRVAYCTDCHATITYQSVPYGQDWNELQKLRWAKECDEHRSLCESWIEEHHTKMTGMHAKQGLLSPEGNGGSGTTPGPQNRVESNGRRVA